MAYGNVAKYAPELTKLDNVHAGGHLLEAERWTDCST
jgi:hypothetical protein